VPTAGGRPAGPVSAGCFPTAPTDFSEVDNEDRISPERLILLLLLGAFMVAVPIADLLSDASTGIPADHAGTFATVVGSAWAQTQRCRRDQRARG
jgi:hypothetical protein